MGIRWQDYIFAGFFAALGLTALAVACFFFRFFATQVYGERAQAVVIQMRTKDVPRELRSTDHSEAQTSAPVFQFEADGVAYTVESGTSSSPAMYDVGETVEITYDPEDPQRAEIHDFRTLWMVPTIIAAIGLGLLGFGLVLFWKKRTAHAIP